jgi:DNA-binding Xre family transcriptional regulator
VEKVNLSGKRYTSVTEMLRDQMGDEYADNFQKLLDARAVAKTLQILRVKNDLPQEELAEIIGWSQSKISKFENSEDAQMRFGDIQEYLEGLGYRLAISVEEKT